MDTWKMIEQVGINVAFAGYLAAMLCYVLFLTLVPKTQVRAAGTLAILVAVIANAAALIGRGFVADHAPLSNLYESLLYVTLALNGFFLLFYRRYPLPALGAGASVLSVLAIGYASLILPKEFQAAAPLMPALQSYWLKIHVSIIVASYAAFALAGITAGIHLLTGERGPTPAPVRHAVTDAGITVAITADTSDAVVAQASAAALPAVNVWDSLTYRLIALGFPLLTIGIIAGAIWAKSAWGTYWSWDPKENWSLITLFIYALYLHGRLYYGWTPQRRAQLALVGFVSVLITYVGVNYFAGGLHSYGLAQ